MLGGKEGKPPKAALRNAGFFYLKRLTPAGVGGFYNPWKMKKSMINRTFEHRLAPTLQKYELKREPKSIQNLKIRKNVMPEIRWEFKAVK